ncbi:MAG: tellurite resistance TerB family protein [Woeseiaceae bacterium]|nr:tellurite resistance TerB family protein [Woeseiaceae bacterium]
MDFNKIVKGLSSSGAVSGFAGGLAGSALVGAVSGKKGRKMAKGALKVGALAAVGGLAYKAYSNYKQQNSSGSAPVAASGQAAGALPATPQQWNDISQDRFEAVVEDDSSPGSLLLIRAMIAAAASDGHMDSMEQDRVFQQAEQLSLSQQDKAALFDELKNPLGMQALVSQVNNPETAVEVYAASVAAIDETRPEAQTYLRALAVSLDIPGELVQSIHAEIETAKQQEAAA